jgi:hypothetical protein
MISISTGPLADASFSPSSSCDAVKIDGPVVRSADGASLPESPSAPASSNPGVAHNASGTERNEPTGLFALMCQHPLASQSQMVESSESMPCWTSAQTRTIGLGLRAKPPIQPPRIPAARHMQMARERLYYCPTTLRPLPQKMSTEYCTAMKPFRSETVGLTPTMNHSGR